MNFLIRKILIKYYYYDKEMFIVKIMWYIINKTPRYKDKNIKINISNKNQIN